MTDAIDIRDYVDRIFDEKEKALQAALLAQEKAVAAALDAAQKAVDKAERDAERWRASANEWRGAMDDRDKQLPSRREVDALIGGLSVRLGKVEGSQERGVGRRDEFRRTDSKEQQWLIAAAGLAVGLLGICAALAVGLSS